MLLSQIALSARRTLQAGNLASYPSIAQYGVMLLTPHQLPADSNFNDSNIALKRKGRPPETFHIGAYTLDHPEFVQKPLVEEKLFTFIKPEVHSDVLG